MTQILEEQGACHGVRQDFSHSILRMQSEGLSAKPSARQDTHVWESAAGNFVHKYYRLIMSLTVLQQTWNKFFFSRNLKPHNMFGTSSCFGRTAIIYFFPQPFKKVVLVA